MINRANNLFRLNALVFLMLLFPSGELHGNEYYILNRTRKDNTLGSCHLNIETGAGGDFATSQRWTDFVGFISEMFFEGDNIKSALYILKLPTLFPASYNRLNYQTRPLIKTADFFWSLCLTVPKEVKQPCFRLFNTYYAAVGMNGERLFYEGRGLNEDGSKIVRPVTYWKHKETGKGAWRIKGYRRPYPLFNLDRIAANGQARIIIVEGPKCVFAYQAFLDAHDLGGLYVSTSWPFGASNWRHADWRYIAGRKVILWPDNDEPGREAMKGVCHILQGKCPSIKLVQVPENLPRGWDVADAIAEGVLHE